MQTFRDDLLRVFFVSNDGTFAFVVTADETSGDLVVRAYRRPDTAAEDERIERESAVCFETKHASFSAPDSPDSDFGPARLGVLSVRTESNHESAVYVMFGGPPTPGTEVGYAWVAIRPEVRVDEVTAFPYFKGSFMDAMTGDDWLESYDEPSYWYSPQRVYRPQLAPAE